MALDMMLKGDTAGLRRLAKVADGEIDCPECGAAGPHDENGSDTLCCVNCGMHFEVALYAAARADLKLLGVKGF